MDSWVGHFLRQLLTFLPVLIVYSIGVILALAWWRRHPKASLFAVLGFGLLLLQSIVRNFLFAWLPQYLVEQRAWRFEELNVVYTVIGLGSSVVGAIGLGLLLLAIFCDRTRHDRPPGRTGFHDPDVEGAYRPAR